MFSFLKTKYNSLNGVSSLEVDDNTAKSSKEIFLEPLKSGKKLHYKLSFPGLSFMIRHNSKFGVRHCKYKARFSATLT